jgi:hypothetical protein
MKLRLIAGLVLLIANVTSAQSAVEPAQSDAGVARVSFIHGDVSTQRGDSGDWATAALNAPIVAGDRVSAGDKSRAELQLDYANILRIDERTQANITNLSKTQIQVQLASGVANYSVLKDSEADVEIDGPNLSVHPGRGDGNFHITIFSDDRAEVIARRGEADVSTPQGSTHLRSGQSIIVTGAGNDTRSQVAQAPARDDFDRWTSDRDNTIRNAQSWSRTNQYYVGSEDLDAHGRWTNVPDYGNVWQPAVGSDWAPYRDGRWVWEPYWGWTWVSYEPWGWAPYHYGRWFMYGSSWVWWPGQSYGYGYRQYRPVWAPAYVSFFGFGGGVGFSFGGGFGSVGWLPIGPCDGFYPWWGRYRSSFNVVNIYNVHNVYNIHRGGIPPLRTGNRYSNLHWMTTNDRIRNGVSTVSAHDFGRGRITARPVSRDMLRNGRMVAGNLPVVPGRESLLAGQRRNAPSTVRGGQNERFFSPKSPKRDVPAMTRSFDREASDVRNAIQRDGHFTPIVGNQRTNANDANGRSLGTSRTVENSGTTKPSAGLRGDGLNRGPNANQNPNTGSNQESGQTWRRTGPPVQQTDRPGAGSGNSNPVPNRQTGGNNADWRRSPGSRDNGSLNNGNRDSGNLNSNRPNNGNLNNGNPNNGNAGGRMTPADRPAGSANPQGNGNQDWHRMDRPSGAVNRGVSSTEAPASRDRTPREPSQPTQDRGNDWRRAATAQPSAAVDRPSASRNSMPTGGSSPQRDSGNWRRPAAQSSGREVSRPSVDMRQPVATSSRSTSAGSSGGYRGNGGKSSAGPASSGGGHPSGSGGGQSHSGGGNAGGHRGR